MAIQIKKDETKVTEAPKQPVQPNEPVSFMKEEPKEEGRKLFANKKANIALGVVAGVLVVAFLVLKFIVFA